MLISEFIEARLDEYEPARSVRGEVWSVEPYQPSQPGAFPTAIWVVTGPGGQDGIAAVNGDYRAEHIARTDPASTAVWVAGLRRVLARHHADPTWRSIFPDACVGCNSYGDCDDPYTETLAECPELRDVAAIWAHHADYQAGWQPAEVFAADAT